MPSVTFLGYYFRMQIGNALRLWKQTSQRIEDCLSNILGVWSCSYNEAKIGKPFLIRIYVLDKLTYGGRPLPASRTGTH